MNLKQKMVGRINTPKNVFDSNKELKQKNLS